ncbi:hypothetical protein FRC12_008921 [Ceratobasidium sp. 428]|nr:hypothetical protein FRC12_008921 [Ceratobasidium sp. 428]
MPEEYSPDIGYHTSVDRKPMVNPALRSPPAHMSSQGPPAHLQAQSVQPTPMSPGSVSGKRKPEEQLPPPLAPGSASAARSKRPYKRKPATESTPPPTPQQALPPMHHIQHVPPPPAQSGYAAALGASNGVNRSNSNSADSRANQDLRRHQEMLIKQQQDAERENARVLAGGLPTPYA